MLLSQNGWKAGSLSLTATYTIPGSTARVRLRKGDTATVLLYVAKRFNTEVEVLDPKSVWGYAFRNVRGSSTSLSNHASGTAIDLNADQHPLGTLPSANYSDQQIAAIQKILKDCDGVVRWGGNYTGRKDGMHFEINVSADEVARLAAKIKLGFKKPIKRTLKRGMRGADVQNVQKRLITLGFLAAGQADGVFGPKTEAAVKAFKKNRKWLHLAHNGQVGGSTVKLLGGSLVWAA